MGKWLWVVPVVFLAGLTASCSHSQSVTTTTTVTVPAVISLSPTPTASMEIGKTLTFSASARSTGSTSITETLAFVSSNPRVVTVSTGGLACAGSWDNLTAPQICTPGPAGVAQVTATVAGVSSPPTTVYVHQHIDNVSIMPAASQPPPVSTVCFSSGLSYNYQAKATSSGLDITSTVGDFTWASTNTTVATLTSASSTAPQPALLAGQATAKANVPGQTLIYATVDGVTSIPLQFNTCAVESITLEINGLTPDPLLVPVGNTQTIHPEIHDVLGNLITGSFLTWSSSNSGSVAVSTAGAVSTPARGGATVIASCAPPSCNVGILPALPVYPENSVQIVVNPAQGTTSEPAAATTWVSSTTCRGNNDCVTGIASIATTGDTTSPPTAGSPVSLPSAPNSMIMDRQGAKIYLGVDSGELGTKGLMVFTISGTTVGQFVSTPGKVLAVSPDGTEVIVSDTVDTPQQVFIFNSTTNSNVAYTISGATAADFSPDSLKGYILAGNSIYVFSKLDAPQTITGLAAAPTGVTFPPQGGFAYVAGEQASSVTVRKTCDNTVALNYPVTGPPAVAATSQVLTLPSTPIFIQSLPDSSVVAMDSNGLDLITAAPMSPLDPALGNNGNFVEPTSGSLLRGCAPPSPIEPSGRPAVLNAVSSFNFGQGNLTPTQLIVSSDGAAAYVLTQNSGRILVANLGQRIVSAIQLTGGAAALQATLSADGGTLFVGASDNSVHLVDTLSGTDASQLSFVQNTNTLTTGLCTNVNFTCTPDLIVSKQ